MRNWPCTSVMLGIFHYEDFGRWGVVKAEILRNLYESLGGRW